MMDQEKPYATEQVTKPLEAEGVIDSDAAVLASLGYKQEFKRPFTPFEVFGIALGVICPFPSIA